MTASYRLKLTPRQLRLLSAVQRSPALKQQLIAATQVYRPGTHLRCGKRFFEVKKAVGAGLVGCVYLVTEVNSGQSWALKQARNDFAFFREALRLEALVASCVGQNPDAALQSVPVLDLSGHHLFKAFCPQPTLQSILHSGHPDSRQRDTLEAALKQAAGYWHKHGFLLDLSPKNLCWNNTAWLLLDSGPKMHRSPFEEVLEQGRWTDYMQYVEGKLHSARSEPSVLAIKPDAQAAPSRQLAFVRDWWGWFPEDPSPEPDFFFVDIDDSLPEDELLFLAEQISDSGTYQFQATDHPWSTHPLIQQLAIGQWRQQFPTYPLFNLPNQTIDLPLNADSEPLSWNQFVTGLTPSGLGYALQQITPSESLPLPRLTVRPYAHWRDLLTPGNQHRAVDIYCQEPLEDPDSLDALPSGLTETRLNLPGLPPELHAELSLIGPGPEQSPILSQRAILLIPGFRASRRACYALIETLWRSGLKTQFLIAHLGVRNHQNQLLVSGGRWESILLWNSLEYALNCLDIRQVDLVAASHGALGAWLLACLHPAVDRLVLDSPVIRPMHFLAHLALARNENIDELQVELRQKGLPWRPYEVFTQAPQQLKILTLKAEQDTFANLCGSLPVGRTVVYQGRHAATLRHDSRRLGLPQSCVDALLEFLGTEPLKPVKVSV